MKIEELRNLYAKRPFRPFIIHLADGQEIPVDHPEFLAIAPGGDSVIVFRPGNGINYLAGRSFDIIDMALVTTLEMNAIPV
ncbi:MAG: hypothetical protein ABIF11_05180 [Nitrospirota bacterium]